MRSTDTGLVKGSKGLVRFVLMFPTLGISEMTIRRAEDQEAVGRGEMSISEFEQRAADRRAIWFMLLGAAVRDSTPSAAQWQTDPNFGARRDAYGPGVHMDATGRPYRDDVGTGAALGPVRPNVYGPGVGMDATGRPVVPDYDLDDQGGGSGSDDEDY